MALKTLVAGTAALALCLGVLSAAMTAFDLPLYCISPMATAALALAAGAASARFAGIMQKNGLVYGFCIGLGAYLFTAGISVLRGGFVFSETSVIRAIAVCCAGAIGGYLGTSIAQKKRIKAH